MDIVYFDLETQRTANDVGGWDKKHQMGMSVGVTYIVGYNILSFDYEVLMAYTILDLPHFLPTLDLLLHVERATGHRLKLEELAQGTLCVGKIAEGLDAIRWWREGKVMEIAKYCCFDVKVTRLVHEHGARHGELFYSDRFGRKQRMEINWKLEN